MSEIDLDIIRTNKETLDSLFYNRTILSITEILNDALKEDDMNKKLYHFSDAIHKITSATRLYEK